MVGRVRYEMGAKVRDLAGDSQLVTTADCSGLVQFLVARGSDGRIILPAGSVSQREWCLSHSLERQDYKAAAGNQDNVLRLCFISAERSQAVRGNQSARHAFMMFNGVSLESHGRGLSGRDGCDPRPWDTAVLLLCDYCFVFPSHP
jgi:hypothetical protein